MKFKFCVVVFLFLLCCCFAGENIINNPDFEKVGTFWSVKKDNSKCNITVKKINVILDVKRGFVLESISSQDLKNENMIKTFSFSYREKNKQTFYDYLNTKKESLKSLNISEKSGILKIEIIQELPTFRLVKTFEFYNENSFFRITLDLFFTESSIYEGFWTGISTTQDASFMISGEKAQSSSIRSEISEKGKWHGFKRFPENRWFGFYYENLSGGILIMCPDAKSWMEIGRSFICNKPQGGFSLELGKALGKELRKNETLRYDFFIMPVKGKISDFEKQSSPF